MTQKELLTKPGISETERQAIREELQRWRSIRLSDPIAFRYSELRRIHPTLEKEDALIAATALVRRLPLLTKNRRHFRIVKELVLFGS